MGETLEEVRCGVNRGGFLPCPATQLPPKTRDQNRRPTKTKGGLWVALSVDAFGGWLCGLCELLHHCVNGYPHLDLDARIAVAGSWPSRAFSTKSWQTSIHAANHGPGQSRDRSRGSSQLLPAAPSSSPPDGLFKQSRESWTAVDTGWSRRTAVVRLDGLMSCQAARLTLHHGVRVGDEVGSLGRHGTLVGETSRWLDSLPMCGKAGRMTGSPDGSRPGRGLEGGNAMRLMRPPGRPLPLSFVAATQPPPSKPFGPPVPLAPSISLLKTRPSSFPKLPLFASSRRTRNSVETHPSGTLASIASIASRERTAATLVTSQPSNNPPSPP
ncbi:hypothetical protein G7Z17_g5904 [Cylindrodendrum hubeiense]|uniref:Uncharacterized protein n=1 Tax=Cylindrodendrum hubeiense TaxID=595255 RepID=A0A9P5HDA5_9HYPO|nr:hypothetical protein G7Z17_g5904 [Cylindrodendrum hubeiense]